MRALVALMVAATPAAGSEHEVAAYGHILTACYAAAPDAEARAACMGAMATECMDDQDGGHTTLGMTFCLNAEASVWDGFLNTEYAATRDWARVADEDEAANFPEFAVRAEMLREAQRAWIAFRDAECALRYAEWGAGSMRTIAHADCMVQMTAERTIDLRRQREMVQ